GRADPDDGRGAAYVRPGLRDDQWRARVRDHGACVRGVRPCDAEGRGRHRRHDRADADGADPVRHHADQPAVRECGPDMRTTSLERGMTYAVLALAALFALYPMALILYTAVQPESVAAGSGFDPGNFATAWERGHFGSYLQT